MIELLNGFGLERKTLIVMPERDETLIKSASNLPNVKTLLAMYLNVVDLLNYDNVLLPQAALDRSSAWLGKPDAAATSPAEEDAE